MCCIPGKAFQRFSGECFFVYLYASNFTIFPQCFDKRIWCLVACKNSESVMTLNVFFSPTLMLLRVIASHSLYLFVCQKDKISDLEPRGTLRARSVLRRFSPSLQDESRSLFNGYENQSKKINVLFVISDPLLEYGAIQKSSEKSFLLNCNLPVHKQKRR